MNYRQLGRTHMQVSEISFGAWAIGGSWGDVKDDQSVAALHKAIDLGVNFIDTADVYGDGRSERLIAQVRRERPRDTIYVATKAGRRLPKQTPEGYNRENLTVWIDRSLQNLEMDALDLVQLHCPHPQVYDMPEVFGILDDLTKAGKIRHYGISVETVDEALRGTRYPNVQTVQIIFNMLRLKPAEAFFPTAIQRKVGILARVPLASGLLTGKMSKTSTFAADDHRAYNRNGESFDKGETFSGVDYDTALEAVEEIRALLPSLPGDMSMAQFALHWILQHEAVTCAIPGAKTPAQSEDNFASGFAPLSPATMTAILAIYDNRIRALVQHLW